MLSSADHWQTRSALAELQLRLGSELKPLWHKVLPQEHGPRHVLVLDSGAVVLMDEWINVPSRHAVFHSAQRRLILRLADGLLTAID